jgi:hypothetical protein
MIRECRAGPEDVPATITHRPYRQKATIAS